MGCCLCKGVHTSMEAYRKCILPKNVVVVDILEGESSLEALSVVANIVASRISCVCTWE